LDKYKNASEYYYGKSFEEWQDLPYFEAIAKRVELASNLYDKLLTEEAASMFKQLSFEKRKRIWKVGKALRDNQKLLDERNNMI